MDLSLLNALSIVKWLHLVLFGVALGGSVVCLMISGLEASDSTYRGLAAALWKQVVNWSLRVTFIIGLIALGLKMNQGINPFLERYLHFKLLLVFILLGLSEVASKQLSKNIRTAALLSTILLLLISFIIENKELFGTIIK